MEHVSKQVNPKVERYVRSVANQEIPGLSEIIEITERNFSRYDSLMVTGTDVLHLLRWLIKVHGCRKVIEVGVFTGASSLAMAQVLPADGRVVAIDVSEEWTDLGKPIWKKYGVSDKITLRLDGGITALTELANDPNEAGTFDLIYFDAVKKEYLDYAPLAARLLRKGGLLVADNVFLQQQVPEQPKESDSGDVKGLRKFNAWMKQSPLFENVAINLSDGVALASKL